MAECQSFTLRNYTLILSSAEAYYLKCLLQNDIGGRESECDQELRQEIFRAIYESEVD